MTLWKLSADVKKQLRHSVLCEVRAETEETVNVLNLQRSITFS